MFQVIAQFWGMSFVLMGKGTLPDVSFEYSLNLLSFSP